MYKIAALIPSYNHSARLSSLIEALSDFYLDIVIVDDGSNAESKQVFKFICDVYKNVTLLTHDINQGKGKAMLTGFSYLHEKGYTHAFQIDADFQHSLDNFSEFMSVSKYNPMALCSGNPVYDKSVPLGRKIGRYFTHVWVWIETLSFRISDSMCGFRIYPLQKVKEVMSRESIGTHMDFDTDLMVKLFWIGVPTLMMPVKVTYPEGNTSNFQLLQDNWRITKMHTKLVFLMLWKLITFQLKRPNYEVLDTSSSCIGWASLKERGFLFGFYFFLWSIRFLGPVLTHVILWPVVTYYAFINRTQRQASMNYLKRSFPKQKISILHVIKHFHTFGVMMIEKAISWLPSSTIPIIKDDGFAYLEHIFEQPKGGVLLVSHLGNMEFCRASASDQIQRKLHVLLHAKNSLKFQNLLNHLNPKSQINLIEVSDLGPETIIFLQECIQRGEWVVIAADRPPIKGDNRISIVPFLGEEAPFSQGPYILASLLKAPVYAVFAMREKAGIKIICEPFSDIITLPKKERAKFLANECAKYATILEKVAKKYPYQWFNFFDFWQDRCNFKK